MSKINKMKNNILEVDGFLENNKYLNTCLKDCADCCRDYFYASQTEFYLTLDGLLKNPNNLDYFYNKSLEVFNFFSHYLPTEIKRLDPMTSSRQLSSHYEDYSAGEHINYHQLPDCIMLNNKRCSVYINRPNTCRLYGTVNRCEYLVMNDYSNDDFTNYHLYPLVENLQLIHSEGYMLKTQKYPLWFYFAYFMRPEFRPYVINNLNKLKELSEDDYIESLNI